MRLQELIHSFVTNPSSLQEGLMFERMNYNRKDVVERALNADIQCGFEAEIVWTEATSGVGLTYQEMSGEEIFQELTDQEIDELERRYRDWWIDSDEWNDWYAQYLDTKIQEAMEEVGSARRFLEYRGLEEEFQKWLESQSEKPSRPDQAMVDFLATEHGPDYYEYLRDDVQGDTWAEAVEIFEDQVFTLTNWLERRMDDLDLASIERYDLIDGGNNDALDEIGEELEHWARHNSSVSSQVQTGGYHDNAGVDNTFWRVEEDGSISGAGDAAEIISPVYDTPNAMLADMKSLFEWLEEMNAETNSTTGLHVTMSMSGEPREMSPLKMSLMLGDEYLLKQFDRQGNSYTSSQYANVASRVESLLQDAPEEPGTLEEVEKLLAGALSKNKMSSINFKRQKNSSGNGLVEFRIGGGRNYHEDFDKVRKAVIQYATVMEVGHDENAYRKQYMKALAKLVRREAPQTPRVTGLDDYENLIRTIMPSSFARAAIQALENKETDLYPEIVVRMMQNAPVPQQKSMRTRLKLMLTRMIKQLNIQQEDVQKVVKELDWERVLPVIRSWYEFFGKNLLPDMPYRPNNTVLKVNRRDKVYIRKEYYDSVVNGARVAPKENDILIRDRSEGLLTFWDRVGLPDEDFEEYEPYTPDFLSSKFLMNLYYSGVELRRI